MDDTPAAKAGIKAGDLITALDGKTVQGLSLDDLFEHMRGTLNSKITLTIKREGVDQLPRGGVANKTGIMVKWRPAAP